MTHFRRGVSKENLSVFVSPNVIFLKGSKVRDKFVIFDAGKGVCLKEKIIIKKFF